MKKWLFHHFPLKISLISTFSQKFISTQNKTIFLQHFSVSGGAGRPNVSPPPGATVVMLQMLYMLEMVNMQGKILSWKFSISFLDTRYKSEKGMVGSPEGRRESEGDAGESTMGSANMPLSCLPISPFRPYLHWSLHPVLIFEIDLNFRTPLKSKKMRLSWENFDDIWIEHILFWLFLMPSPKIYRPF